MRNNIILGTIVLLFDAWYLWEAAHFRAAQHFFNSSSGFPVLLGMMLGVLTIAMVINSIRKKEPNKKLELTPEMLKRGGFYLILMALYIFLGLKYLGFIISSILFIVVGICFFREVKWYFAIASAIVTVVAVNYIFTNLLYVTLP